MKRIIIITVFFTLAANICAQKITNVSSKVINNRIYIYYSVDKIKFNKSLNTKIFVSFDGGKTFTGPLKYVTGDVGENIRNTKNTIVWNPFEEVNSLDGDIVFDVRAEVVEKEIERKFFINYSPSILITSSDYFAPFGLQVGQIGKIGWYATIRLNNLNKAKYNYNGETLEPIESVSHYYKFTGNAHYPTIVTTAGITLQLKWNSFIYLGGGYRRNQLYWELNKLNQSTNEIIETDWASLNKYKEQGAELELGLMFTAKFMTFSFGGSVFNFKHFGAHCGVGINF